MVAYALKGFGWFLCGVIVAPACYLVSSQVAAERARVEAVDRAIGEVRKDIRTLETEFNTRANLAQLERWNGDVLALQAPQPGQFLPGETALAALDPAQGMAGVEKAMVVVPAGVPAAALAQAAAQKEDGQKEDAAAPRSEARVQMAAATTIAPADPVAAKTAKRIDAKGQALAALDKKLLSGTTLDDLVKGARREAVQLR